MPRLSRHDGHELLRETTARYARLAASYEATGSTYTEAAARADFIDRLLAALGWDLANEDELVEREREVSIERTRADGVAGLTGRPDYTLRVDGRLRLFWEAKRPAVDVVDDPGPAFQVRTYGWTASQPVSVLTNFRTLAIYDTTVQPSIDDAAYVARRPNGLFGLDDLVARFDELWELLSRESIAGPTYEQLYGGADLRGGEGFDTRFLDQIRTWRLALARVARTGTPNAPLPEIARRVQRILNRLLFLRICEERGLEDYERLQQINSDEQLAAVLREADRTYNAGLFATVDRDRWALAELRPVIEELYYPRSPFAFGVIGSETLASVYEQFLGEQITLEDDELRLTTKPEVTHSGGVVPTPVPIVDAMLDRVLAPEVERLTAEGTLSDFTLCDLACGSGVFLIRACQRLLDALEAHDGAVPPLATKRELARRALWGIDIDSEAVEVARFGLLLALLDGETPTRLEAEPRPLLPNLDENVTHGNSLIDFDIDRLFPGTLDDPAALDEMAPFSWSGTPAASGGFSAIVGNPPYVRIQVLAEHAPLQLRYFQSARSPYVSARAFNFDKYLLFLERALALLAPDGVATFIVPHRFLTSLPGAALRDELIKRRAVREIVSFGTEQVFPGRTTYTCILVLSREPQDEVAVELVSDVAAWLDGQPGQLGTRRISELGAGTWDVATNNATAAVFERIHNAFPDRLEDFADIFVGVQTSADRVFLVRGERHAGGLIAFVDQDGIDREIEAAIVRPALVDRKLEPYLSQPEPDAFAIFPYEIVPGRRGRRRALLIPPQRMQAEFPLAWAYLCSQRERLVPPARSPSPYHPAGWYCYGRSQSLTKLDEPKVIVRVLSREPQYCYDAEGLLVPGGGDGGPYYLIRPKSGSGLNPHYLIALLSHPAIDRMVVAGGRAYRGDYYVHRKQFMTGIPVPRGSWEEEIAEQAAALGRLVASVRAETDARHRTFAARLRDARRTQLETAVSGVLGLSPEELAVLDA